MPKKTHKTFWISSWLAAASFLLTPFTCWAADASLVPCSFAECSVCHLLSLAGNIISWLLGAAFLVAVFFVVVSGYRYLWAAGDEERMAWAKKGLKFSLIGFAICLLAWLGVHAVYTISGYQGSWWQMECAYVAQAPSQETLMTERYKNEITPASLGGRDNPITLGDLAATGIKNLPEKKYFFLHGLGGQPLASAAQQLAKITTDANRQGKFIYVITPKVDPDTFEIMGSQAVSLTDQLGPTVKLTEKNIRELITGLVADSPSGTNFPFFITSPVDIPTEFNNLWPESVATEKSLKTYHNGVVYQEGEELLVDGEQTAFNINLSSNNAKDPKKEQFTLNRENPVTFNLPEDISPSAAKQMAVDIAQTVAETTKNAQFMDKDQWTQLIGLMSKTVAAKSTSTNLEEDENQPVYNPAVFASYAVKNSGQTTDPAKLAAAEKELDQLAKTVIDKETSAVTSTGTTKDTRGFDGSVQDYVLLALSSTPNLDNWIAQEKSVTGKIDNFSDTINVNRVPTLDPNRLSKIGGHISTNNILGLKEREALRDLIVDIQKEIKDNTGVDYKIPPDLVMCIFNKESKFDPGAMSQTGCSGLGQLSMGAAKTTIKKLKNFAPKHFAAFADKIQRVFGVDLEATLTQEKGDGMKRVILRSDPNLNAALAYVHLTNKGVARRGIPASSLEDLRRMVNGYGPGNSSYATSILECLKNLSWRIIPEKIQEIIKQREAEAGEA
jgi:hypothetical protein